MSLSKIVVSGKVTRQPEKRFTPNNNMAVTEFSIAVESPARQDQAPEASMVKVVTWGELAERAAQGIKKGDLVAVDGRLQMTSYTTSEGQRRREAEINAIAVENLSCATTLSTDQNFEAAAVGAGVQKQAKSKSEELDSLFANEDEIPF